MTNSDGTPPAERLRQALERLLERRMTGVLERAEKTLADWRRGDNPTQAAHNALLGDIVGTEHLVARISQNSPDAQHPLLRDAFDAQLIDRDEFVALTGVSPNEVEPAHCLDRSVSGLPAKRAFLSEILALGPILIHVDARVAGVSVPLHLKQEAKLVLRFGYNLTPAIPDLTVDDAGVSGTLTFAGMPHHCKLPWAAIYAAVSEMDERGMVWPDDVPEVVLEHMAQLAEQPRPGAEGVPAVPVRPVSADTQESPDSAKSKKRRRASHLKLVD